MGITGSIGSAGNYGSNKSSAPQNFWDNFPVGYDFSTDNSYFWPSFQQDELAGSSNSFFSEPFQYPADDSLREESDIDDENDGNENLYESDGNLDELVWTDQSFYWTGQLGFNIEQGSYLWTGLWLGSFTGRPMSSDFLANQHNIFEYISETVSAPVSGGSMNDKLPPPLSGMYSGCYLMEGDDIGSLIKYTDRPYYISFSKLTENSLASNGRNVSSSIGLGADQYCIIGKGCSDDGLFVISGTYNSATSVTEISRQYLACDDFRASMSVEELRALYAYEYNDIELSLVFDMDSLSSSPGETHRTVASAATTAAISNEALPAAAASLGIVRASCCTIVGRGTSNIKGPFLFRGIYDVVDKRVVSAIREYPSLSDPRLVMNWYELKMAVRMQRPTTSTPSSIVNR
jgi:hypothetical protein